MRSMAGNICWASTTVLGCPSSVLGKVRQRRTLPFACRAAAGFVPDALVARRPRPARAGVRKPAMEARVRAIVAGMTLEQKVGQMTQPKSARSRPTRFATYYIGSILNGGGAWPDMNKHAQVADWLELSDAFYHASMSTDMAVKVPVIWGTDAVHGHNNVYGATLFPHNIGLGAAHDPASDRCGSAARPREQVRATGITWAFAPTLAVVQNPRWGRTYESYSSDPAAGPQPMAKRWSRGLQGQLGSADIRACHRQALSRRRRHVPRRRPGRNPDQRGRAATARTPPAITARSRADVQTVMVSYYSFTDTATGQRMGQDARQRASHRRRAEAAARLRRLGGQRLERQSSKCRAAPSGTARRRSMPAST